MYTEGMDSLNQNSLETLLPTPAELIPPELITAITVGFIALNVLGLCFIILYIVGLVRKWKVESAVLHMQKDLAEIKQQLAQPHDTSPPPVANQPVVTPPADENRTPPQS